MLTLTEDSPRASTDLSECTPAAESGLSGLNNEQVLANNCSRVHKGLKKNWSQSSDSNFRNMNHPGCGRSHIVPCIYVNCLTVGRSLNQKQAIPIIHSS